MRFPHGLTVTVIVTQALFTNLVPDTDPSVRSALSITKFKSWKAIDNAIQDSKEKLGNVQKEIKHLEEKLKSAKEKADKLLTLAMEGAISKEPAYKTKMDAADIEIVTLEDKISKLEAQRKVAQMSANSGEFLYSNIRFAMKYIDRAPPEARKAMIQALIKSITMFDDHVELRMHVGRPFEEIACHLPEINLSNLSNTPKNAKTPQNTYGVLTADAGGSNGRQK